MSAEDCYSLAEVAAMLSRAYDSAHARLAAEIAAGPAVMTGVRPEEMQDYNGRYILLDALTALANVTAALRAHGEAQS